MALNDTLEHYSWLAYEAAFFEYGIDDDRTWAALNAWLDSLGTVKR